MRLFAEPYVFSRNERWTLALLCLGAALALVFAWGPPRAWPSPGPLCPSKRLLDLDCPGCGLTRATVALARLEPGVALRYNPLVLCVAPYAGYLLLSILLGAVSGRRPVSGWPRWFVRGYELAFVGLWLALAALRLAAWISPGLNPSGLGLPPA